jgi:flagellar hook assembly protein FlgD
VEIIDTAGRIVRRLAGGDRRAGAHSIPWDGRDDAGRLLPAGRYFARIRGDGVARIGPVTIVR